MFLIHHCSKHFTPTLFFVAMFFAATLSSQQNFHSPAVPPYQIPSRSGFIAAFELSPETGFDFTWPYESMRPAPYLTVLVKVKKLPSVFYEKSQQSKPLLAARYLRVNGKRQTPRPGKRDKVSEQFAVRLEHGRLRFSLEIPEGARVDPRAKTARIELYEVNGPGAR